MQNSLVLPLKQAASLSGLHSRADNSRTHLKMHSGKKSNNATSKIKYLSCVTFDDAKQFSPTFVAFLSGSHWDKWKYM